MSENKIIELLNEDFLWRPFLIDLSVNLTFLFFLLAIQATGAIRSRTRNQK